MMGIRFIDKKDKYKEGEEYNLSSTDCSAAQICAQVKYLALWGGLASSCNFITWKDSSIKIFTETLNLT